MAPEEHRQPAQRNRVLIIEDESAQRRALSKVFRRAGIEATLTGNGLEAFRELRAQDYGCIVCDIKMPDQSGVSFFEQLEMVFPPLASRVVFVTAWADEPETSAFLAQTGQPVLAKPYEVQNLLSVVQKVLTKPF